jgi:hypothetical protein
MERLADMSPRAKARLAGVLYLLTMVLGGFAQGFISDRLVISGDAAATATNILANPSLFRLGFAIYLIEMACQITMVALFYELFKPVSKTVSMLAAIFGLVGCTIKTLSRLFFIAPFLVLGGAPYLSVFNAEQLQALALLFLRVNHQAETIAMVFFGFYALLQGYLIMRSGFLPRVLGVLSVAGGLGWLTYLYEPLSVRLVPFILAVAILGALSYVLWLLIFGVNEQHWKERAIAAESSIWR